MEAHVRQRFRLSAPEVEDIMQDVLLELMRYDEPVRDSEALAFRVVHLRSLQVLRYKAVRRESPVEDEVGFGDRAVTSGVPVELLILVKQTLRQATPACRRLLRAHYLEGRTLKETAATLSYASANNVWTLLDRCVRRLRSVLGATR
jgi:RNA polymerase sigma factor (sigma-70 family)